MKALRRQTDVQLALAQGVGAERAARVIDVARRAVLRDVRAPREAYKPARDTGELYAPPRSARAELGEIVHGPNAPCVRRAALLYTWICSWLGPRGRTGHAKQEHRLNVGALAAKVGLEDPREVERYLAVFRQAGLLRAWQPPRSSGLPYGRLSGHCFSLYELDVPPELEKHLARFHHAWWPRRGAALAPEGGGAFSDASQIAAALRRREAPS